MERKCRYHVIVEYTRWVDASSMDEALRQASYHVPSDETLSLEMRVVSSENIPSEDIPETAKLAEQPPQPAAPQEDIPY